MPYNSKEFGIVISRLRTKKGLSQETFSALAGIARSHLTTLENGGKTVRLDTFCRIAEALDMHPSELMKLIETEEQNNKTMEDRK